MTLKPKERPILFSAPMVRAILDGRKTQTRRTMKQQPSDYVPSENVHKPKHAAAYFDSYCNERKTGANPRGMSNHWCWWTPDDRQGPDWIKCPYGIPGDRLWVRETTWYRADDGITAYADGSLRTHPTALFSNKYVQVDTPPESEWPKNAKQLGFKTIPAIHMPRRASRITLEITAVRVERLQDITTNQILAEGIAYPVSPDGRLLLRLTGKCPPCDYLPAGPLENVTHEQLLRAHFASLWDSINGAGSWNVNPWVWVIEFRREAP